MRVIKEKDALMKQSSHIFTVIRKRPQLALLVLALLLLVGVTGGFLQARRIALERVESLFEASRDSHRNDLAHLIDTPLLVPEVLARSRAARTFMSQPNPVATLEQNVMLEEVALAVQVDVIYFMDLRGTALAASNWRAPDSFVGHNYQFRPYFLQALSGQTGRYTAKGVTSLKTGHYLSRPVTVDGKIAGVVVAKISFDTMQLRLDELWRRGQELVLITDENGVIVVSPLDALTFKAMQPMPEATRKAIEASRQYGSEVLTVPITMGVSLSDHIQFVRFNDIPGRSFLQQTCDFPDLGFRLVLHLPASRYWNAVAEFTAMFSLLALIIGLICITMFQRWAYAEGLIATAIRDPLTGLHTRLYMKDWCEAAINAHNRDPRDGLALVVFDLDLFKRINDVYGHLAGDEVLKRVGALIRAAIRGADLAVRFGGEELAVFVRSADPAQALAFAERICHSVEQTEFQGKAGRMHVTLSGGVACHVVGETLDALFARADVKLYEAKELGRNQVKD